MQNSWTSLKHDFDFLAPFFRGNSLFISKLGAMVVLFKLSTFNPEGFPKLQSENTQISIVKKIYIYVPLRDLGLGVTFKYGCCAVSLRVGRLACLLTLAQWDVQSSEIIFS